MGLRYTITFYNTDRLRIIFYIIFWVSLSMTVRPFIYLPVKMMSVHVVLCSTYNSQFRDILTKFCILMCFGPVIKRIENNLERTIFTIIAYITTVLRWKKVQFLKFLDKSSQVVVVWNTKLLWKIWIWCFQSTHVRKVSFYMGNRSNF